MYKQKPNKRNNVVTSQDPHFFPPNGLPEVQHGPPEEAGSTAVEAGPAA